MHNFIATVCLVLSLAAVPGTSQAQATLDAPAEVAAGAHFYVGWTGPGNNGEQIVIVPQGAADRTFSWSYPAFPKSESPIRMGLDQKVVPGAYELRHAGHPGSVLLATRPITIIQGVTSLDFPDRVLAGSNVAVAWAGPGMKEDKIAIGKTGEDERYWKVFAFTSNGNPRKRAAYLGVRPIPVHHATQSKPGNTKGAKRINRCT